MNKVILVGRLGKDPEMANTPGGKRVAKFSLATSEKKNNTNWHNVVLWEKTAEIAEQYAKKGDLLLVEGYIQYRTWEKSDGSKGYATDIIGNRIELLTTKQKQGNAEEGSKQEPAAPAHIDAEEKDFNQAPPHSDEDLPF